MSPLDSFTKWLKLKIYQLEVTFSVYIFTPLEKFIFYSVLFLLVSLTFIATILYLPGHVSFILDRAWFYAHGDAADAKDAAARTLAHALAAQSTAAAAAVAAAETVAELVREEL
ncbi:hypothetical protein QBC33DRAFT_512339 [Phialemonium atrogriseum]|uniref:Uncharacterized protein n=1 Tax=Phialemonium atrogriseum TaxID=1093897 RepID=A0AAJ0C5M1_9PEZI|nr:uncharacterized protein QBC33DRAFT_512339 [Phialemonium atrogriseum]KAK1770600.1 hypothetical protein QBC33DRAFT_512339 [Phialemonium atrogriseum]